MRPARKTRADHAATAVTVRRAVVATAFVVGWTALVAAYAWLGEPGWIEVSHGTVGVPGEGARPFRIVQLGDLHLQRIGERERRVAAAVREAGPDLVVLCGDLVDGPEALPVLDAFLALLGVPRLRPRAPSRERRLPRGLVSRSALRRLRHAGSRHVDPPHPLRGPAGGLRLRLVAAVSRPVL
jgi:hypothetical protein